MAEVAELKKVITYPVSFLAKKFTELNNEIEMQANIISRQQRFLELLDRKERGKNIMMLGPPV